MRGAALAPRAALAAVLFLHVLAAHARRLPLPDTRSAAEHEDDLPGWGGEQQHATSRTVGTDDAYSDLPAARLPPRVKFLSWDPRIILVENFLSPAETAHIIKLARASMERSSVVDSGTGGSVVDQIRTSSGTFLRPLQDAVVEGVQRRIAELSMLPVENQESMQVLHYGLKEKYGGHMDTFFDARHTGVENGGQRIATALTFLNEPLEGGETVFPNVPATNEGPQWSACARDSLAHKPRTGDMILFWSLRPDGTVDMGTTHSACPVIRGEKWSAPLWIRQGPFQQSSKRVTAAPNGELATGDACVDLHAECRAWAQSGECKRNAAYMIGDMGRCRDSCNACPYPKRAVAGKGKGKHT